MFYYLVWVRSNQYRGSDALTYRHEEKLVPGTIVVVPLRELRVLGIVMAPVRKPPFTTKQISHVYEIAALPATTLKLGRWLQEFYPSPIGVIASQLLPHTLHLRNLLPETTATAISATSLPPLTDEQQAALDSIKTPDTYLLHGRTGSGKTRLYIELARTTLESGRSVIILSPEIGLTSQLALHFRTIFGARVVILHSQLSGKERETAWLAILSASHPLIVIGPRSALFSPLRNVGLIVIDEAHDQAYKQEQAPYYHAVRVASQLRSLHRALLVLGSATPAATDYYVALQKAKPIIKLTTLAVPSVVERRVTVIDMKDRSQFTRTPHLSRSLIEAIAQSLERHEQAMLYLNRRGTARVALCTLCGWQARCPHCDLPLTYHGDSHVLRCHVCGYTTATPASCPECGNASLTFQSFGTKAIVDEVSRLFPEARIRRFDADNVKADRLEHQYQAILHGDVDILVGTQMIAKGLDLPRLSTLGVVLADSSLYLPDYTAQERTYQLLTQVIGRVGRGHIDSHIVIQTFSPDSPLLHAAVHNDWSAFYNAEIAEREQYFFPPFSHLLKLTVARASSASAEKAARQFKDILSGLSLHIRIEGPAPAFHEKARGKYVWQLVVKARNRAALIAVIGHLPKTWTYDIDPSDLI